MYLLKSNIDNLPDDDDVAESNIISRYVARVRQLEMVTLADYVSWYDQAGIAKFSEESDCEQMDAAEPENFQPRSSKQPRKRKVSRIIRCVHFNESSDSEKFAREKLMLFWRDETNDILGGFSTFNERYEFLQEDLKVQMQLYEPYVDEVKQVETAAATDEVNNGILWRQVFGNRTEW